MSNRILQFIRRLIACMICIALLSGFLLIQPPVRSEAKNYGQYKDVAKIYDQGNCPSMQGMSVCGTYIYACKINGNTDKEAVVARVNNDSTSSSYGSVSFLTNSATGTKYFSDFGHGNDIEVENINGTTTLFVPTSTSGSGSLVRYKISGTTATKVGNYTMTSGGSNLSGGAIRVTHFDDTNITFLFKSGKVCYTGTLPISQTSGTLEMTKLCTLDYTTAYVNGTAKDTSKYSLQGMGYHDYKLYLPLSGHTVSGHENISIILVYDLEGASGTISPDPNLTFCITSSQYSAYFEVESCEISPKDGRMYFSANRRVSSSDTNHDGVSYISNWTYDPTIREGGAQNYRWELRNNELVSTTNGGNVYNGIHQMEGFIEDGTITNGRFVLSKPVVLEHDQPWILEWKASGASSTALLFATEAESKRTDRPYIFRRTGSSIIAIGAHDGTGYHNYGLDLSDYGVDGSATHVYRMTNKIASDGTNMVYLSVDGKELGALNQHYIASTYQNETSDWISGQDLSFSYLGTLSHKISDCRIDYIQVWHGGLNTVADEPNTYRWESGMASMSTYGLTENTATLFSGSTSGSTYTDCRYDLERDIVLMHNLPWVLEWDNSGTWSTGILLAADHMSNTYNAPYLFRGGSIIAIGHHDGSKHAQWGVKLADHGISINEAHTYGLKNIISDDGSNMIWLYVDGDQIAPMNTYCTGGTATATTSNELSGRDFVFSHMGTFQHDLTGGMEFLQVWEAGKPSEDQPNSYRWETQNNALTNISNSNYQTNTASYLKGSCATGVYTDSQYMLDQPVILRHDRPWQLEWQCEGAWTGGGLLLSSNLSANSKNNVYIFRNSKIISIGQYTGSRHEQWGVCPADYGIDHSKLHTYKLVNEVAADGCNMIYLYVDGSKIAPMTSVAISGTPDGTTSNWVSGKDFVFSYVGSKEYTITKTSLNYLQVTEGCSHSYGNWSVITAATCTASGSRTRSCSLCGEIQTETIDALNHSYDAVVTAPTCSAQGYTTHTCNSCGYSYRTDVIDATGHSYENGTCGACGEVDPDYVKPVVIPTLTLKAPALEFKDMIKVVAFYTAENIEDVVEMGMITYKTQVETFDISTADHVIPGADYEESSGRYFSSSQGIHAKYLSNTVYLACYAKLTDGSYVYTKLAFYSPITYAANQLENSTNTELKQLCAAMLNYGAAAQNYFLYNTENLANASLTDEQKALPEAYRADMVAAVPAADAAKQGIFANNQGFSSRRPAVSFEGAFSINYFFTPKYAPVNGIMLYYWTEADFTAVEVLTTENASGAITMDGTGMEQYRGDIEGIAAKNLSQAVYVAAIYSDGSTTWTSGVLGYSIGAYCSSQATKGGAMADLAMATAVYGYHAKQYFG